MPTYAIEQDRYQPHQWWLLKGQEIVGIFAAPNAKAKAEAALVRVLA